MFIAKAKKSTVLILLFILTLGLFFRSYKIVERFGFGHDTDLLSWIIKDIVIDHHPRLIGQQTSALGVFIGPLYYYSIIPFYMLTNMDPVGGVYFTLLIGTLTIFSYYFVFSRLFNQQVGFIASFLHAVLFAPIGFDRWLVPTITTKLWSVWYLYCLIQLGRGKFYSLPILGVMIGLIWHVHLALLPTLLAIPVALLFSKKIPDRKNSLLFLGSLGLTSLPFILFELKHNFIQIGSIYGSFFKDQGGIKGLYRIQDIGNKISTNISDFLLAPTHVSLEYKWLIALTVIGIGCFLAFKKILKRSEALILATWAIGLIAYFSLSSTITSEYYFSNLEGIYMLIVSLFLYWIFKSSFFGKVAVVLILGFILSRNLFLYFTVEPYHIGYSEKKAITEYIVNDSKAKGFPCVAINYITMPGENTGFRYLFFLHKLKLAPPSNQVPVYSIVFPYEWSKNEVTGIFGHMGVIAPAKIPDKKTIEQGCSGKDTNLEDSMFGFVE